MWATAKGNVETIKLLVENGAKLDHLDNDGLDMIDLAVQKQIYPVALYLYQEHGLRPKDPQFYKEKGATKHFDFELFFQYLEENKQPEDIGHHGVFFERAKREHEEFQKKDLVVDTRETWTQVFTRLRDFEEQKLIPRDELPEQN